jgi:hypothetical protein
MRRRRDHTPPPPRWVLAASLFLSLTTTTAEHPQFSGREDHPREHKYGQHVDQYNFPTPDLYNPLTGSVEHEGYNKKHADALRKVRLALKTDPNQAMRWWEGDEPCRAPWWG